MRGSEMLLIFDAGYLRIRLYATADMIAEHGIVNTHAQTILPASPHLTALMRLRDPTPMMAPVMV